MTPAIRQLRANQIPFEVFQFPYQEKGGTRVSSSALGIAERFVIKSIVFEDDQGDGHLVLMHGDLEVSGKALAREAGRRSVSPADSQRARKWTGYEFGGTSPFGLKTDLRIWVQSSILDLETVWVNGGKRGFLVGISPRSFVEICGATPRDLAQTNRHRTAERG